LDEDEIYQERILEHYEDPYHRGPCPRATHAHEDDNPLCGDVVRVELRLGPQGQLEDAWFQGEGCCISQASASMLMERMEGRTLQEARQFSAEDMLEMFGARLTPNRQKCCLLAWRVLQQAIYSPLGGDGAARRTNGAAVPPLPEVDAARDTRGGDGPG
jgi:nitrogen fixation NifU-like protein